MLSLLSAWADVNDSIYGTSEYAIPVPCSKGVSNVAHLTRSWFQIHVEYIHMHVDLRHNIQLWLPAEIERGTYRASVMYFATISTVYHGNAFPRFTHDDVTTWKHFPFLRGIHRSPVNSPHKGQWREALMFSLICAWINDWVSIREAGDLRRHRAIMTSL